ncbi:MAG: beta-lactamase family protein [Pirellulales bacterium]|nr:beta-lactamase family protein [Pirellulales bacterium]
MHRARGILIERFVRLRRIVRLIALTFATFLAASVAAADEARLAAKVESLLPPHVGAAVTAIDDGAVVFQRAWGRRRCDAADLCTPTTNFRLASVSKHFTATAVLRLVDQGQVRLDDTLDEYFSEHPDFWRRITVHHLLTHTSGLPDYEGLIPAGTTLQLTDLNVLAILRAAREPLFEPGTKFAYSNSGYALLGLIVEAAARQPLHDFLRAEVFDPVGMRRSVLYVAGMNEVAERAYGHEPGEADGWLLADQSVTSAVRGDGGVYSSLDDLARWLVALDQGALLSEASARAMFAPHVRTDRGEDHYGYGWFLGEHRGQRRTMHAGSTRGFSLMLQRFPDRQAAVVILLNRSGIDGGDASLQRVVDCLLFD